MVTGPRPGGGNRIRHHTPVRSLSDLVRPFLANHDATAPQRLGVARPWGHL